MNQFIVVLILLFSIGCGKSFEAPTESAVSSTALASTVLDPQNQDPTEPATAEPLLPEKARVEPVLALTFDQIRNLPIAISRPTSVKTDLDECFSKLAQTITYDSIGAVPLMPNSNTSNVTGDVIIPDANDVSARNLSGSLVVEKAEMITSVSNLTGADTISKITARLTNIFNNVKGSLILDTWAINSVTNATGSISGTSHAVGTVNGGSTDYLQYFGEPEPTPTPAPTSASKPKVCLSSQEIESVDHIDGKVVLVNRGEAGDLGRVRKVARVKGSIVAIGLSVSSLENITTTENEYIYLESSNTAIINGNLAGPIYLNGTKVDSLVNNGTVQTTVYLMNGSAVARIAGKVKLVQPNP